MEMRKPPLGLMPRTIHMEFRLKGIREAMLRYVEVNMEIPLVWIEEYNDLVRVLKSEGNAFITDDSFVRYFRGTPTQGFIKPEVECRLSEQERAVIEQRHLGDKLFYPTGGIVRMNPYGEEPKPITIDDIKVGDAITRTVTINADNSLSMLLPQVLKSEPTSQYQSYADPVSLSDSSERGRYQSSRQDKVVYVMQEGGNVQFPPLTVKWWNTNKQQVETVLLEGKTFHVTHTPRSFVKAYWSIFAYIAAVIVLIIAITVIVKRYLKSHEEPLAWQYRRSIWKKNFAQTRLLLYIKLKRERRANAFNSEPSLADIGEKVIGDGSATQWKAFWHRIKPEQYRARHWLTPLRIDEKLQQLSKDE